VAKLTVCEAMNIPTALKVVQFLQINLHLLPFSPAWQQAKYKQHLWLINRPIQAFLHQG